MAAAIKSQLRVLPFAHFPCSSLSFQQHQIVAIKSQVCVLPFAISLFLPELMTASNSWNFSGAGGLSAILQNEGLPPAEFALGLICFSEIEML